MLINEVLTLKEAAELYGISISALRYACTGQKGYKPIFTTEECRQSGKTWLITRVAMDRVYKKK